MIDWLPMYPHGSADQEIVHDEVRRYMKIRLQKHLKRGYKPTHEEQLACIMKLVHALRKMPIALEVESLNEKMYETPCSILQYMFGSLMKDSACYFKDESTTLDEAEIASFELYCERAQIQDGQRVLDLGCGWGALTLYIAKKYKQCHVTAITNSVTQKDFIMEKSKNLNLPNVRVILADITKHETDETYDRIMVIELFEHMKNYELLFRRVSSWMKDDGLLFVQYTCHKAFVEGFEPFEEEVEHSEFLIPTGSTIIPSASLFLYFQDDVSIIDHWTFSGKHYSRSCEEWLKRLEANADTILKTFPGGKEEAKKSIDYWRVFNLETSEFFGCNNGEEYMSAHTLWKKK